MIDTVDTIDTCEFKMARNLVSIPLPAIDTIDTGIDTSGAPVTRRSGGRHAGGGPASVLLRAASPPTSPVGGLGPCSDRLPFLGREPLGRFGFGRIEG